MVEKTRLNKYIAECGVCSRRDADKLIEQGRVTVNGHKARPGEQVSSEDEVIVSGKRLMKDEKVVLAYYKPLGVTCTESDMHAERTLKDALDYPVRVTYAGRLDRETEGLLLMTNDGELIDKLMKGNAGHEKEYYVEVTKPLASDFKAKMEAGVFLSELNRKTRPCKVRVVGENAFYIILTQGLNRQIRRMCKELGYNVAALQRIRVANITLGKLRPGTYRKITGEELEALYSGVGIKR